MYCAVSVMGPSCDSATGIDALEMMNPLVPIPNVPIGDVPICVVPDIRVTVPVGAFPALVVFMKMLTGIVVPTPVVAAGGCTRTVVGPLLMERLTLAEVLPLKFGSPA